MPITDQNSVPGTVLENESEQEGNYNMTLCDEYVYMLCSKYKQLKTISRFFTILETSSQPTRPDGLVSFNGN